MTIHLDPENDQTLCKCDVCGLVDVTANANGVVPAGWGTGHLWLDVSLSEQRQTPLCFCASCWPGVMGAESIALVPVMMEPQPDPGQTSGDP